MFPLVVAILVAVSDQIAKECVRAAFRLHEILPVVPGFFNLTYVRNTGAAWGMFSGQNLLLALLAVAMLAVLAVFRNRILPPGRMRGWVLGLLAGGIAGNLIDRVRLDYVVDFLDFHAGASHFPAFNIADMAISCGVGLYLLATWLQARKERKAEKGVPPASAGAKDAP